MRIDRRDSVAANATVRAGFAAITLFLANGFALPGTGGPAVQALANEAPRSNPSGLALPRFVSLKASRAFARKGPAKDAPIAWVYERAGLPVEVIQEYDVWRQIRDSDGSEAWVLQGLLSGKRTALIQPWSVGSEGSQRPRISLYDTAAKDAKVAVVAEAGTLAEVTSCDGKWCRLAVTDRNGTGHNGFIPQSQLWGVYLNETVP
jgi:SH3-like domain-containing protein